MSKKRIFSLVSLLLCLSMALFLLGGCTQQPQTTQPTTSGGAGVTTQPTTAKPKSDYPNKPIEFVVPMSAGGSHDLHARAITAVIGKYLSKPVNVNLKPGASGAIGTDYVAKSKADGYTLLFHGSGPGVSVPIIQDVPYTIDSFDPIWFINASPTVMVVHKDSPFQTMDDFIQAAIAKPNTLSYASTGAYGAGHMSMELLIDAAGGIPLIHVPFDGGGPALTAILGQQVDISATMTTQTRPLIESGDLRALALTSDVRDKGSLSDVPTLKELGYDTSYAMGRWVVVPKGCPEDVLEILRDAFKQICEDPDFIELIEKMGEEVQSLDPDALMKWWYNEIDQQRPTLERLKAEGN